MLKTLLLGAAAAARPYVRRAASAATTSPLAHNDGNLSVDRNFGAVTIEDANNILVTVMLNALTLISIPAAQCVHVQPWTARTARSRSWSRSAAGLLNAFQRAVQEQRLDQRHRVLRPGFVERAACLPDHQPVGDHVAGVGATFDDDGGLLTTAPETASRPPAQAGGSRSTPRTARTPAPWRRTPSSCRRRPAPFPNPGPGRS